MGKIGTICSAKIAEKYTIFCIYVAGFLGTEWHIKKCFIVAVCVCALARSRNRECLFFAFVDCWLFGWCRVVRCYCFDDSVTCVYAIPLVGYSHAIAAAAAACVYFVFVVLLCDAHARNHSTHLIFYVVYIDWIFDCERVVRARICAMCECLSVCVCLCVVIQTNTRA